MEKKDEQLKQAKKKALSEETSKSREASPPKRSKKTEISKEKSDPEKHPNVINLREVFLSHADRKVCLLLDYAETVEDEYSTNLNVNYIIFFNCRVLRSRTQ